MRPPRKRPAEGDAPFHEKALWGLGGFGENMANNALVSLANVIYQVGYGLNPVVIGWVLAASRIFDAVTDPWMGNLSDNTRSRWGRRRPYVVLGAVALSIAFALLWLPPAGLGAKGIAVYLALAALLFYLSFTLFVIPYSALGLEMVTDYRARTRLFVFRLVPAFLASLLVPTLYAAARSSWFGGNELVGMRYIGVFIAVVILVTALPAGLFCRERYAGRKQEKIRLGLAVRETLRNRAFVILLGAVFLTFFGLFCAIVVYSNLNIYHIAGGSKDTAAKVGMHVGLIKGVGELMMLPVFTLLAMRFQKHRLAAAGLLVASGGYLLSLPAFRPDMPYLQLAAYLPANLGLCACWLLNGSMMADVCDSDELATGRRREGMFSAVFSICYKAGIATGALFGNYLLQWCGVRGEIDPTASVLTLAPDVVERLRWAYALTPALCLAGAAWFMCRYPLTRDRMAEIRRTLTRRQSEQTPESA